MVIYGKERGFLMTVGASAEISALCPDGDLSRLAEVFEQPYGKQMHAVAQIIVALNKGYNNAQRFNGGEYCEPLTADMVLSLDTETYMALTAEAMKAFNASIKTSVETAPTKKAQAGA